MKDDKFQELVHLYLDGEIRPREFRRLMAELSKNPARHDYFLQHCRLHRALSIAMRRNENPRIPSESQIYERISKKRGRRSRWPDYLGALAACIIVTFFALPPALVNSWLPGNLGQYTEEVRGGVEYAVKDNLQEVQDVIARTLTAEATLAEGGADASGEWVVDPWDENLGSQPWWEFRTPNLERLSRVVEEEAFTGFSARELRVIPFRGDNASR